MALRLRRDVQKSSYYVWFLGAEEARGLRGPRVINPVLPYLIDRSREQEPLKVTLQVSHKGIKILQGSSKHFIPHSAITSSVQTDDIVACVLLLYNPATKCPLHVHAYRCDSDSTAEALHQQLQILVNRPENQKRFEELESRLGIAHNAQQQSHNLPANSEQKQFARRIESSPKRFESSLGSDTGNSTRESECSEEQNVSPISASPPIAKPKGDLFDSLAAELRAKLNGNGPPLLLPPRDYDTVHRSKGNLAAIELRRCRNSLIVGGPNAPKGAATTTVPTPSAIKQMSSRGSSGIGSDLAPSPERQELHSSSEEENWSNEMDNSVIALKASQIAVEKKQPLSRKSAMQPPEDSYLRDLPAKPFKSLSREKEKPLPQAKQPQSSSSSTWSKEDDIRPIIMRPSDYDAKFKRVMQEDDHHRPKYPPQKVPSPAEAGKYHQIEKIFKKKLSLERENSYKMQHADEYDSDQESDPGYRKENLTDKQKFQEYSSKRVVDKPITDHQKFGRQRYADPKDLPFETVATKQLPPPPAYAPSPDRDRQHRSMDRGRDARRLPSEKSGGDYERNPYREPESMPYIESMEKMMKSPVMRYKSFDSEERQDAPPPVQKDLLPRMVVRKTPSKGDKYSQEEFEAEREFAYSRSNGRSYPDKSISAKDRFNDAKEKFHAMERTPRYSPPRQESERESPPHPPRRKASLERPRDIDVRYEEWTDEESAPAPARVGRHDMAREYRSAPQDLGPAQPNRDVRDSRNGRQREASRDGPREMRSHRDMRDPREMMRGDAREMMRDPRESRDHRDPREFRDPRDMVRDPRDARERDHHHQQHPHRDMREPRDMRDYRHNDNSSRPDGTGSNSGYPQINNARSLSNLQKGYRHSYAEPALMSRAGGRVGLAAVNPF